MKTFLILLLINFVAAQFESKDLEFSCTYSEVYHPQYEYIPTCTLYNNPQVTQPDWNVIKAYDRKTNSTEANANVEIFYASAKIIQYIPKRLKKIFPSIWGLRFENTQLKYITKDDLKPFKNLTMFISYLNHIEFLEEDLFVHNQKLEMVSFRSNRIRYIDPNIFDHIRSEIKYLWLDGTAIGCGIALANSNSAAKKQIDYLKEKSACGKIENAPPTYIFWYKQKNSEGTECEDDCQAKIDAEINNCRAAYECALQGTNCDLLQNLPQAFLQQFLHD